MRVWADAGRGERKQSFSRLKLILVHFKFSQINVYFHARKFSIKCRIFSFIPPTFWNLLAGALALLLRSSCIARHVLFIWNSRGDAIAVHTKAGARRAKDDDYAVWRCKTMLRPRTNKGNVNQQPDKAADRTHFRNANTQSLTANKQT